MKSPADSVLPSRPVLRRRSVWFGVLLLVGIALLGTHGFFLRQAALVAIPWLGKMQGYEVRVGGVQWIFFTPLVLRNLTITGPGTELRIEQAEVAWSGLDRWGESPRRWIERVSLRGVDGTFSLPPSGAEKSPRAVPATKEAGVMTWLPRTVEAEISELRLAEGEREMALTSAHFLLSEDRAGWLKIGGVAVDFHDWKKELKELAAVTAWRGGVAYLADLALAENFHIDTMSVATVGGPSLTLESRAFGGYVYADLTRDAGDTDVKAAVTVLNVSLDAAGEFAGLADKMQGRVDLAKVTFNGETADPLSGQLAVRFEARDFAWQKRAFHECNAGLSLAGRRLRLNELLLGQKNNRIKASGSVEFPQKREAWREAPFEIALEADVREVRALAELIGGAWKESSGSLRIDGQAAGKLGEGNGWLLARGWNLRLRGVPVNSLEAQLQMSRSDINISGFEAWSDMNFMRASGEISLAAKPAYRGRMEMRVSEVARYLEPLGRFAPDWAREGGVLLFWDGDGSAGNHSGVTTLELVQFSGDLNPVPVNLQISATYSPENLYLGRCLLTRGPLSLSTVSYFGPEGLAVEDLQVFNGSTRLLQGEVFMPLSFSAMLERRPWRDVIVPEGALKASVRTDDLELGAVAKLFGQQSPIRGRVDWTLQARGKWMDAEMESRLSVSGLQAEFPSFTLPESGLAAAVKVGKRKAELRGSFTPAGGKPVEANAVLPLIGEGTDGQWTLLDRQLPWEVSLKIPPTDVGAFALKNGRVKLDAGNVSGQLQLVRTVSEPVWSGAIVLQDGRCVLPDGWMSMDDIQVRVSLDGATARLEEASARSGDGKWILEGSVDGKEWRNLKYDVAIKGERLELFRNDILDLRGNVELRLSGEKGNGSVKGDWNLAGSRLLRGIAVTPRAPTEGKLSAQFAAPFRAAMQPFAGWNLDVRLGSADGLSAGSKKADGSWRPDMRLFGTLSEPLLEGSLAVADFPVKFPSAVLRVTRGAVNFSKDHPWMPQLNLAATGEIGGYEVRAAADGMLSEGRLTLTSFPVLSAGQVLTLLHEGSVPLDAAASPGLVEPEQTTEKFTAASYSWLSWSKVLALFRGRSARVEESPPVPDGGWQAPDGVVGYDWTFR